jgi:2-polyprenyl-6-methoxyphenol hydroxylase-like FAD-dependent oxidoreductase
MADVAVVGGGLVGLLTGILLARRGHHVVVVDSDEDPPDGSVEDDFGWSRPGVPQGWHGHVWRARIARVLREDAPDVLDALEARGVGAAGIDFGPGFADDRALMARRPIVEAVLRRLVRAEPGVELRTRQRVTGLEASTTGRPGPAARPRVVGVRLGDGERLPADLVIDCGGRRSRAPEWLRRIGTGLAVDEYMPCDLHYFARHYRLRPGAAFPSTCTPPDDSQVTPYGLFLVMAQDNGTFCLAGALSKSDPCRDRFRQESRFDAVMAAVPGLQPWLESGTPFTDIRVMGGLANRRRSLLGSDGPVVDGYVLIGDASLYTNATFGQGVALGFWQAQALAQRADLIGRDHLALLRYLETWTDQTLGARYAKQVMVDEAIITMLRDGIAGAPLMYPQDPMSALFALRARGDTEAARAAFRIDNLLTEPDDELSHPPLNERVTSYLSNAPTGDAGPGPLPRAAFEAILN